MNKRLRGFALVLALAGSGIALGGPSAGADSSAVVVTGQGWWTQLQSASLPAPAPAPPNVKPGQLNVQGAPDGARAVAAFKATLGANDTNPTLTLTVASDAGGESAILLACRAGSAWTPEENGDFAHAPHVDDKSCVNAQRAADGKTYVVPLGANDTNPTLTLTVASDAGGEGAILLACRAGSAWTPEENGDFTHAPHDDDKSCVNAQRAADGKTYVVPLGTLQFGNQLDVVFTAGKDPALPTDSTFQLVFEKIEANAIATTPGTAPTIPTPHPLGTPAASPAVNGAGSGATSSGSTGGSSFHAPSVPPSASFTPTPALPADKLGQTATSPVRNAATAPKVAVAAATGNDSNTRLLGLLVLVAGLGLALWAWRDEAKVKLVPAEAAVPQDGGLGRFVRPRTGPPPALT
jgi:hypothetical protein